MRWFIFPSRGTEVKETCRAFPKLGVLHSAIPSLALFEVAHLHLAPKVRQQISPGQSEAPPWVVERLSR
jgi:hypothetical protein